MLQKSALLFGLVGLFVSQEARAEDPVVIVAPQDGAVVPAQFTVKVTYGDIQYCDTDGCFDIPAETVALSADSSTVEQCLSCPAGGVEFDIMLGPGEHTLEASAAVGTVFSYSDPIKVSVEEAAPTDASDGMDPGTSSGTGDGSGSSGTPGDDDGCACGMTGAPSGGLVWLGISLLLARRRRAPIAGRPVS
ncbi:hypothetical protein [Nannocystis bainbridge]|uniref:MYXO-CTERM domain-containing protein n=1 Tax=Nannocystis bainbridge TaxID=2995303 RepID=A0ABT5DUA0_9BACT|nr:hypothetical protein [Nannocystis bainbridge]MDC0717184.1 hypothetical protein [Nannocystis bainbridge]